MTPTYTATLPKGVEIKAPLQPGFEEILTPQALTLVAELQRRFNAQRHSLLEQRSDAQQALAQKGEIDFLAETSAIRQGDWTVAPLPQDLQDRRVEITGPVDRKMVINALNSGAKVFMADFEDSNSPTWENNIQGQINLRDAVNRTITFKDERKGKFYTLNEEVATLMVRPRGWHLTDKHILVDGQEVSGSIMDFALYLFHNAHTLLARSSGPYFTSPSWRATSKPASGMKSSSTPKARWAFPWVPSRLLSWSKPYPLLFSYMKFSSNSGTTQPA